MKKIITACALICAVVAGVIVAQHMRVDYRLLNGADGKASDLEDKIIVVNYFAEWCAPCLKEIPELNRFSAQLGDDTRFFALSWDNLSEQELQALVEKYQIKFDLMVDTKGISFPFSRPQKLPATFIVDTNGKLAKTLWGEQTQTSLHKAVEAVRATSP